jgi:hypothetical protein
MDPWVLEENLDYLIDWLRQLNGYQSGWVSVPNSDRVIFLNVNDVNQIKHFAACEYDKIWAILSWTE